MQDQIASNLGNNIRQLREARGMTQEQMARVSGVPRPTWANMESGAANPTLTIVALVLRQADHIGREVAAGRL